MSFDIDGAKKAGYSDTEIADHLAEQNKFDAAAARKAGYTDSEIIQHMSSVPAPVQHDPRTNQAAAVSGIGADGRVLNNAVNKGISGGIDTLLNAPTNLYNLVKAGVGTALTAAGKPDWAPDLTPTPNVMTGAMRKTGMINQGAEPQNALQRVLDTGGQYAGAAAVNPAGSLRQAGANVAKSGLAGLLAGGTKEATGSDLAGSVVGVLAPVGMSGAGNSGRQAIVNAEETNARNATRNATIEEGRKLNLVLPPSQVNDSFINNKLESIAGKAAIKQEALKRSQVGTNAAIAEQLGLPSNEPITPDALHELRQGLYKPYEEIRQLPPLKVDAQYQDNGVGPRPFKGAMQAPTISAGVALDNIKQLRADAKSYLGQNNGNPAPDIKAKGNASLQAANQLEGLIDRNLQAQAAQPQIEKLQSMKQQLGLVARNLQNTGDQSLLSKFGDTGSAIDAAIQKAKAEGSSELLTRFRDARKGIAQTYTVENMLNQGDGNVAAPALGRALKKGVPLEGNMLAIAKMAQAKGPFMAQASGSPTPGVSALEPALALAGAATGGAAGMAAAGLPLIRGPVRAMLLSEPYQRYMAKTKTSPSMMAKMLSKLPPDTPADVALQAITNGRVSSGNRLSDLLGEQ